MSIFDLIEKPVFHNPPATVATIATVEGGSSPNQEKNPPRVANVASVAGVVTKNEKSKKLTSEQESKIANFLLRISRKDETEKIINECSNDLNVLAEYLRLADTLEVSINSYTGVASFSYPDNPSADSRVQCRECQHLNWHMRCAKWRETNPGNSRYEPVLDVKRNCLSFMVKS